MIKKTIFLMTTLILIIVSLFSCGGKAKPEHVYRIKELELPPELAGATLGNCATSDGMAYICANLNGEAYLLELDTARMLRVTKPDFGINEGGRCSLGNIAVVNGRVWLAVNGNEPDADGNTQPFNRLYLYSDGRTVLMSDGGGRITGLAAYGDSAVLVQNGALKVISPDGSVDELQDDGKYSLNGVFGSEQLYAAAYTNDQDGAQVLLPIDLENKSFGEAMRGLGNESFISSGDGALFCSVGQDGIYEYTSDGDGIIKQIAVDFMASDIDSGMIKKLASIGNDEFVVICYDGEYHIGIMSPVPEDEIAAKEIITVAALDPGKIRTDIIAFNHSSESYHVRLVDYSGDQASDSLNRLNLSLVSKDAPDILIISDGIDYDSMVSKNMFVDLYSLMDKDKDFDRDEYLGNILEAYETGGKLYSIANRFVVDTFAAKKTLADKVGGFGLAQLADSAKSKGASVFSSAYGKKEFIEAYLEFAHSLSNNISDTNALRFALEFAATLPDNSEGGNFRDDSQYREDRALLSAETVMGFDSYDIMCNYTFGEEGIYVGFPDGGSLIRSEGVGFEFAILKSSKHMEGAWEFVKSFFSEDAQMPSLTETGAWSYDFGFPVLESAIIKQEKIALDGGLSDTGAKAVWELIGTVKTVRRNNDELNSIVYEEASAYFAGQKGLDEVLGIIADRAATLAAERGQK